MAQLFDHRRHPKFESGKKMREEILADFLANFQSANDNGRVSEAEFLAFYGAQSAAVDSDIHFDWLVRSTWKI
jgi:calcyphosin